VAVAIGAGTAFGSTLVQSRTPVAQVALLERLQGTQWGYLPAISSAGNFRDTDTIKLTM
jgi:hypothetical protein